MDEHNIGNVITQEKEKNSVRHGPKYKGLVRDEPFVLVIHTVLT